MVREHLDYLTLIDLDRGKHDVWWTQDCRFFRKIVGRESKNHPVRIPYRFPLQIFLDISCFPGSYLGHSLYKHDYHACSLYGVRSFYLYVLDLLIYKQPRKPGSLPTPGAAIKTLVQAGHVTPQNLGYF